MLIITKEFMRLGIGQMCRGASSCGSKPIKAPKYSKRMIRFKKLQQHYQRDDGLPIFLKGGPGDRLLYYSTLGLCAVGLIMDFQYYAYYYNK